MTQQNDEAAPNPKQPWALLPRDPTLTTFNISFHNNSVLTTFCITEEDSFG